MVKLVKEVTKETTESSSREERWNKKTAGYSDTICDCCHGNVRQEEKEQRRGGKGARIVLPRLSKVEELLDGGVRVRENETCNLIVLLTRLALKRTRASTRFFS